MFGQVLRTIQHNRRSNFNFEMGRELRPVQALAKKGHRTMGHHGRNYGYGYRGGHDGGLTTALGAMPRGLKIALGLVVLTIGLVGLVLAVLVAWVLIKLVSGGSLPSLLQDGLDFVQRNLRPLLDLLQRLLGFGK